MRQYCLNFQLTLACVRARVGRCIQGVELVVRSVEERVIG